MSRHIKGEIMTVWKRNSLCFFPLLIDISTVLINGTCYAWRLRGDCSAPSWNYLSSCVLWKLMRETQKLGGTTYSLRNDRSANCGWRPQEVTTGNGVADACHLGFKYFLVHQFGSKAFKKIDLRVSAPRLLAQPVEFGAGLSVW